MKEFLDATLCITEEQGDGRVAGAVKFWQEILMPFLPQEDGQEPMPGDRSTVPPADPYTS